MCLGRARESMKVRAKDILMPEPTKRWLCLPARWTRGGAHPKIAAWDNGLYVRKDGRKSTSCSDRGVPGSPVMPRERLLGEMMSQFTRTGSGPGSIRQLQLQEWSDKPSLITQRFADNLEETRAPSLRFGAPAKGIKNTDETYPAFTSHELALRESRILSVKGPSARLSF